MSRARWFIASAVVALAGAGLAVATPAVPPPATPLPAPTPPAQQPANEPPPVISIPIPDMDVGDVALPPEELVEDPAPARAAADDQPPTGRPLPDVADPLPRPRMGYAVIQALDKVNADSIRFAVPVGQQRRWRGLVFNARACETTAPDEPMRDSMAYLEIYSQPRARDGAVERRRVFQGWMYASSPALSGLQHPLYDAWVISCQTEDPGAG